MEKQIISAIIIIFIGIQLLLLYISKKYGYTKLKSFRPSIVAVCLYNVNLMVLLGGFGLVSEIIARQVLPVLSLLVFKNFYIDFYRTIEKKLKQTLAYFFVSLLPIVMGFILAIDLLRMLVNSELSQPSINVFHKMIVVIMIGYQLFVLTSLWMANYKLYRASLTRYGQVFVAHILVDSIYIVLTLVVFITDRIEDNIIVTGILFSLYAAFLMINAVRKEWLPHANTQPMVFNEGKRKTEESHEKFKDRRALDSLTGVFTRTYFFDYLRGLDVNDDSLAIVLMDVSGLKLINESFGYHMGDEILLEMSVAVSDTFVKGSIARISGRIFAVLVSGQCQRQINEKILMVKAIADQRKSLEVQLNFGYYIRGSEDLGGMEVYKRAEEELYYNKTLVNQKHQKQLSYMLHKNFKSFMPALTDHMARCAEMCLLFGQYLNLDPKTLEDLQHGALLHDIALVNVPKVSVEMIFEDAFEERRYKNHVTKGYEIALETGLNQSVAQIINHHHERFDGQGFPHQLRGEAIDDLAMIVAVVDFVDVYLTKHKTREGLNDLLRDEIEVAFSREMVYNMIAFLNEYHFKGENYGID